MIAPPLDHDRARALLSIAFLAGFADGRMHGRERAQLRGLARSLAAGGEGLAIVDRLSIVQPPELDEAVGALGPAGLRPGPANRPCRSATPTACAATRRPASSRGSGASSIDARDLPALVLAA